MGSVVHQNTVEHGKRYYKQMSLEVAVRNPERYEHLLKIFKRYNGTMLDDEGILDIYVHLYQEGFLTAKDRDFDCMTYKEIEKYVIDHNKHNNEWGFPTGYQAAFTRYLKTLSEFGFIYSQYKQTFLMSEIGLAVANGSISISEAFALQSMRFWRKSPFRRVLNDFNYFSFVLKAMMCLQERGKKLTYPQFLVSLFSDDGNVDEFIKAISDNRFGMDLDKAYSYVHARYSEIDSYHAKVSALQTAFKDYGNTVFRVLQLTGFITVEYSGVMLMSINENRLGLLKDLLNEDFRIAEHSKDDEFSYFKEIGSYCTKLENVIKKHRISESYSTVGYNEKIPQILKAYNLDRTSLKAYLMDICEGKKDSKGFWFIQPPIKLELLLTLYLYSCYGDIYQYKPNFKCDTAGIPYSHAPGNIGDIEITNENVYWLIEATLIRNKQQQLNNETMNLIRHIAGEKQQTKYLELVAPYVHDDTKLMIASGNLISMSENSGVQFFSKASDLATFVSEAEGKNNLKHIYEYAIERFVKIKNLIEIFLANQ